MPTYVNNNPWNVILRGENIPPGGSVSTVEYLDIAELTLSDAAPYYNPLQFYEKVEFAGAETKTVSVPTPSRCPTIRIQKISEGITINVYLGDKTGNPVPVALEWDMYDPIFEIDTEYSVGAIVIESSGVGSCQVIGIEDLNREVVE